MPRPDDTTHIRHMLEAAEKLQRFSAGRTRADLETDELLALGLVRLLEIIGEAATRVTDDTRRNNAAVPWAQMIGMRNRLIHGYDVIDLDILWRTITDDVPALVCALEKIDR
jgi:uncharacterized protein with HEPN domain